jgi:hypothetical protein
MSCCGREEDLRDASARPYSVPNFLRVRMNLDAKSFIILLSPLSLFGVPYAVTRDRLT